MAISAAAKSNHGQLFGDRVSSRAQSDPELVEFFGDFAFDEVRELLAPLSGLAALNDITRS
jgi:4-carboxymuconolactone decarboxylase